MEIKLTELLYIVGLSFVFVVLIFKKYLSSFSLNIFSKDTIDYQVVVRNLSEIIAREIDQEALINSLQNALTTELKVRWASISVYDSNLKEFRNSNSDKLVHFSDIDPIVEAMQDQRDVIILRDQLHHKINNSFQYSNALREQMKKMGIAIAIPVIHAENIIGIILLGPKLSGNNYNVSDVKMLNAFSSQMATALEKSRLYEEVQVFTRDLQSRIDKATADLSDANKELSFANDRLKHLDKAKSEFLSIASHQLRTPMTAIKGYLAMVLDDDYGKVPPKIKEPLKDVFMSSDRLIRMVNVFLNVSRIESGSLKLNKTETSMIDLICDVVNELKQEAEHRRLKLRFDKAPDNFPKVIMDADKIREVILNLVDNSIKYTKEGCITIKIFTEGEDMIRVSVCDTGMGITPDEAEVLFGKFVRGDGGLKQNASGAGLGLFIAKKIVESHGGDIWAESRGLGKGSIFTFTMKIRSQGNEIKV